MSSLPPRPVIGILHPGAMGAALGSALKARAGAVIWADAGRTHATAKRAELADLIAVPDVAELAARADVIVSICPPHAAREIAEQVAGSMRESAVYVDANAVAPDTVRGIAALLGPDRVCDGAVIGPPAWERGTTTLWLSGPCAAVVAELFEPGPFDARVLGTDPGDVGAASGLKACFALQSKAMPTLWLALEEAAARFGVTDALHAELDRNGVDHAGALAAIRTKMDGKAWRWAGEMDEAADALAAIGVPDGFSRAAAELYRRAAT
ncbi:DUF1932 domain-containing protein [Pseudonocardia nematodicida]|uniref:DUF1932 domain-containing protein n=1 Tax=Pseudonocardia nematodicida TaxID=1206997 RepID=A0ABV1K4D0_9PSEU